MNIIGEGIKLKLDYSNNETRLLGVIDCACGKQIVIDKPVQDGYFDFESEKGSAHKKNADIDGQELPEAAVLQEKLDKALALVDYLQNNGMFNNSAIIKSNNDKEAIIK